MAFNDIGDLKLITDSITEGFNSLKKEQKGEEKVNEGTHVEDPSIASLGKEICDKLDKILGNQKDSPLEEATLTLMEMGDSLEKLIAEVKAITGNDEEEQAANAREDGKKAPTSKITVNDIKNLNETQGLGFALLYWKLDDICNILNDKKADSQNTQGGGIGSFFSGLLKGAAGLGLIAVALVAFAGALLIFSKVQWMPALAGLISFAIFTTTFIEMAKSLGKEIKTLYQMAKASMLMSASLGVFAISVYISSQVFSGQPISIGNINLPAMNVWGAIGGIAAFTVFTLGLIGLSKLVKGNKKNFVEFSKGAFFMSLALGTFALSMSVVGFVFSGQSFTVGPITIPAMSWNAILMGLGSFTLFGLSVALMAKVANKSQGDFKKLAVTSVIMTGALAAFALGMVLVGSIFGPGFTIFGITLKADVEGSIAGILSFVGFSLSMIVLTKIANGMMADLIKFTGVSMLMSLALATFSIGVGLTAIIAGGGGGQIGPFKISGNVNFGSAMAGLGMFTIFIASFTAMSLGLTFAAPFIAPGMVVLLGMAGVICALGGAFTLLANVLNGGTGKNEKGEDVTFSPLNIEQVDYFFLMTNSLVEGFGEIKFFKAVTALAKATVITPLTLMVSAIANCLMLVGKSVQNLNELGGIGSTTQMFDDFNNIIININKIKWNEAKKAKKNSKALLPVAKTISKMAETLILVNDAADTVAKNGGKTNLELFDTFTDMIVGLSTAASQMGQNGYYAAQTVKDVYLPVTDTIWMMVDIIQKVADLDLQNGKNKDLIPQSMRALHQLVGTEGGQDGFLGMFNFVVQNITKVKGWQKDAMAELLPMADTISTMVDVVGVANKVTPEEMNSGYNILGRMKAFIIQVQDVFAGFKIERNTKNNMKLLSSFMTGTGDYEGIGLSNSFDTMLQLAKEASEINPDLIYTTLSNTLYGINLFSNMSESAITNLSTANSILRGLNAKGLTTGLDTIGTTLGNLYNSFNNANPFILIQNSIDKASTSISRLNSQLNTTISKIKSIGEEYSKVRPLELENNRKTTTANNTSDTGTNTIINTDEVLTQAVNLLKDTIINWDKSGVPIKASGSRNNMINLR